MIDVIAFDADDTLWHNEILYLEARDRLVQLLARYQSSARVGRRLDPLCQHE
jgi:putative hydrolase of the HAD superfamily